jgi:site-specific DNA-methyltransferase (adenine-specific)
MEKRQGGKVEMTLYKGDCLQEMKRIPDGSVDMILTDPPYGTTACKWDSIIPLEPMWEQLKRVIKPNGAIVMTASQPFTTTLIASNMKMFKYCWVWEKSRKTGHMAAKVQPMKKHEDIAVFGSGRLTYNPQGLIDCDVVKKNTAGRLKSNVYGATGNKPEHKQKHTNYPSTILSIAGEHNVGKHPTQKPVALMEYLIKTYTNEGETVLDFTMGSGTTGVACVNQNRQFIGIEKDDKYYEIAKKRIQEAEDACGLFK